MLKTLYPKLAAVNMKNHAKVYCPYILSCIGTIMMYYFMEMLKRNESIGQISGGETLKQILSLGSYIIAIFAVIFLFYTNSFLIKRRKKEFGLFNILGMEKRHIAKIMFYETLYTAVISLIAGIAGGILLSKLMYLLLLKILNFEVAVGFEISASSVLSILLLFGIIFLLTFVNTLRQVYSSRPVELLKGGQVGEKEPKTKWLLTMLGILCLGSGYSIALTTESPLDALYMFFVAVLLVIVGTYFLFMAGSIALLKGLRKKKNYYYQTRHFISVSGMIYRMKQNAVGLASICILSTAVLVMVSGTVSLYAGIEEALRVRFTRNISVQAFDISDEQAEKLDKIIKQQLEEQHMVQDNAVRYRSISMLAYQEGNDFLTGEVEYNSKAAAITCIPVEEYNRMENLSVTLQPDEVLVYALKGSITGDAMQLGDTKFQIKEHLASLHIDGKETAMLRNSYYIIMPDIESIENVYLYFFEDEEITEMGNLGYFYGFDIDAKPEEQMALTYALDENITALGLNSTVEGAEASRESFYSIYGGLLFIGILLGLLFLMATVLIIYYKQISEGYDDKERFEIMQKVGMSHEEVKKAIHSQVLTVFFLPLLVAGIHIAAAFKMITKLLAAVNLTNVPLFALSTIGTILVFAIFYIIIYSVTAREYYKIVQ